MQELNWRGFNFAEVEPDYTSQICPVCSNLNHESRNGKDFTCTCCGYHDDADHVGAINIRARYEDSEVMDICKKTQYIFADTRRIRIRLFIRLIRNI